MKQASEAGEGSAAEPRDMQRRQLLIGAGIAGLLAAGTGKAAAQMGVPSAGAVVSVHPQMQDMIPAGYDPAYVEHVIMPFLRTSFYQAEGPSLPMIGEALSKQYAIPHDLWGLLYDDWAPSFEKDGLSVFILGLDKRGPDNRRKRIYMSALTTDLYPMYAGKIQAFFDQLLNEKNAGKPLMRRYLDSYFDLFWDLHLGVKGDEIPAEVRQIGESFNTVLGFRDPMLGVVYENYMKVRALRTSLKNWIDDKTKDVMSGKIKNPERTFVYYWTKNGGRGEDFRQKDIVFECFHNFGALSQWGNTIYNIMLKLDKNSGDPAVRSWFARTMESDHDKAGPGPFTPLHRFVMELFRTITPNAGSISTLRELQPIHGADRYVYAITPHLPANFDTRQWKNPLEFDPDRYIDAPTSDQIGEAKAKGVGFAKCPFDKTSFPVNDGRKADVINSAFGTVFGVVDGKPLPVCDHAGYAPFGFGYRRCPGEQLNIEVFSDFLRKVWANKIEFEQLAIANPAKVPIGLVSVIDDNIGFKPRA